MQRSKKSEEPGSPNHQGHNSYEMSHRPSPIGNRWIFLIAIVAGLLLPGAVSNFMYEILSLAQATAGPLLAAVHPVTFAAFQVLASLFALLACEKKLT